MFALYCVIVVCAVFSLGASFAYLVLYLKSAIKREMSMLVTVRLRERLNASEFLKLAYVYLILSIASFVLASLFNF